MCTTSTSFCPRMDGANIKPCPAHGYTRPHLCHGRRHARAPQLSPRRFAACLARCWRGAGARGRARRGGAARGHAPRWRGAQRRLPALCRPAGLAGRGAHRRAGPAGAGDGAANGRRRASGRAGRPRARAAARRRRGLRGFCRKPAGPVSHRVLRHRRARRAGDRAGRSAGQRARPAGAAGQRARCHGRRRCAARRAPAGR